MLKVTRLLSWATGYSMPRSETAARTFSGSFSNSNSGVWTPMMSRPSSAYLSCQSLRYGRVRMQLTQVYVQKSSRTILPLRSSTVSGSEFIQPSRPSGAGRGYLSDVRVAQDVGRSQVGGLDCRRRWGRAGLGWLGRRGGRRSGGGCRC